MMSFLNQLSSLLNAFIGKFRTEDQVSPEEGLDRFVPQSNWVRKSDHSIKEVAFLPSKKSKNTSVFRTGDLDAAEIWPIGEEVVLANRPGKRIHGTARVSKAKVIHDQELEVLPEKSTHALHANIENWPEEKEKQLDLAKEIVASQLTKFIPNT